LRALRPLRSNRCDESVHEARKRAATKSSKPRRLATMRRGLPGHAFAETGLALDACTPHELSCRTRSGIHPGALKWIPGQARDDSRSRQPPLPVFGDEMIVDQVWVVRAHAVEFSRLAGAQSFFRVQAPDAFQQSLAAQNFVATRYAAAKVMRHVEQGAVAVRDLTVESQQLRRDITGLSGGLDAGEQFHRPLGPDAPVPQQTALDPD